MKKLFIIVLAVLAILSPFIVTYVDSIPGVNEMSFVDFLTYAFKVVVIIGIVIYILHRFINFTNNYYFLLCDWNDHQLANHIAFGLQSKNLKLLPPSIDFYITNTRDKERKKQIDRYLDLASGAVIVIGKNSLKSDYFNYMIKAIKRRGLKVICIKTCAEAQVPQTLHCTHTLHIVGKENIHEIIDQIEIFLKKQ